MAKRSQMPLAVLVSLVLPLLVSGCDPFAYDELDPLEEGQQLEVVEYDDAQPASRAAYAGMGTFVISRRVVVFDPGTGPDDPPRILRSIRVPGRVMYDAQIDRDGFVWIATPDRGGDFGSGPIRESFVVDPYTATVHRVLALPSELRATAALLVGPEKVYLRAWRNGFSGGIGAVDRQCVFDETRCEVEFFTELGDVGNTPEQVLHISGESLYSFSGSNSRANRHSTDRIDLQTGEIIATSALSGSFAFDDEAFYVLGNQQGLSRRVVVRLDKETLGEAERMGVDQQRDDLIAVEGDRLYLGGFGDDFIQVRSAETLGSLGTIDISAAGDATAAFGFVAPGVLMLNHTSYLDVEAETVMPILPEASPIDVWFSQALRLSEGHPRAY